MTERSSSQTRRSLLVNSAAAGVALTVLAEPNTVEAIEAGGSNSIRPFRASFPQEALDDLRRRVLATRFPQRETVTDGTQGVPLALVQNLSRYWASEYDFSRAEANLNRFPQFITEIDGLDIHFIHVRSRHANALPVIVTHGWPGSVLEQIKVIGPLTDPTAYGGHASDAFDVVIPSMPGYGFSGKPTTTGWDCPRIARAWTVLMQRLGYQRYVAQGGDWGSFITEQMAVQRAPELVGIHVNLPSAVPAEIFAALPSHTPPTNLSADERYAFERLDYLFTQGLPPFQEMGARPQTLYAIEDSPVGLAAWFLDHDIRSRDLIARSFEGQTEGLTRDDVLDNVTLTWLTKTAVSGARLYWENKLAFFVPVGVTIPTAVSAFPDEVYQVPRSWAERAYPNLVHYNRLDRGGHFAAWEQPALLTSEMRASFRSLRRLA
jgi:pimeloyl-ACP methyl ester carboxylesterase